MTKQNRNSPLDYHKTQKFSANLAGKPVSYFSKPGLPSWKDLSPSDILLADHVNTCGQRKLLFLGCGNGATAIALARQNLSCTIWLTDSSQIALEMSKLTLAENHVQNAQIILPDDYSQPGQADIVIIKLPKGRSLARRWLLRADDCLRPGGMLYLAGGKDQGIQSVVQDAEALFSEPTILGYKKGHRAARFVKPIRSTAPRPSWTQAPGVAPGSWIEFEADTPAGKLRIFSLPGVFSADRLDPGTALLLRYLHVSPETRLLDMGCGTGIIGLVGSKLGTAWTDLIDSNLLAISSSSHNISANAITKAEVIPSDALAAVIDRRYSLVASNPPFHSGYEVDFNMAEAFIHQAWHVLIPGGNLLLVVNQFIRYDSLIYSIFSNINCLVDENGYRILSALKR